MKISRRDAMYSPSSFLLIKGESSWNDDLISIYDEDGNFQGRNVMRNRQDVL